MPVKQLAKGVPPVSHPRDVRPQMSLFTGSTQSLPSSLSNGPSDDLVPTGGRVLPANVALLPANVALLPASVDMLPASVDMLPLTCVEDGGTSGGEKLDVQANGFAHPLHPLSFDAFEACPSLVKRERIAPYKFA